MSLDWLLGPQLRAFADAGYDVVGISAPGPHVAAIEAGGVRHVAMQHATRAMAPREDLLAVAELRGLLTQLDPDIVHTHNPKPGLYGRLAARLARVPAVVNTVHGLYASPEDRLRRRLPVYALERAAAACSHAELLQNEEDRPVLARLGVPEHRLTVIGNGIDLSAFDPVSVDPASTAAVRSEIGVSPDEIVVGAVGRLVAEKGYRELFAAARVLRTRCPRVRLVVVGPEDPAKGDAVGPDELSRARDDGGVVFLGERHDMASVYSALDLYVLASYREGFPRSAMEAASMGLPVVATDIRGCRQVVDHGRTGLLVAPRDAGWLADAIELVAGDTDRRLAMARAGRAKAAAEFDVRDVIRTTLGVYERLLSDNGQSLPASVR